MAKSSVDVTLSCDTAILAGGDVIADSQEIAGFFRHNGDAAEIKSIVVIDEDDQGAAIDLVFMRANVVLGAENSTPSISDANSREIVGRVSIAAADFTDLGGAREATKTALALIVRAAAASKSLWVAAITRSGTPTYSAAGLKLRIGYEA